MLFVRKDICFKLLLNVNPCGNIESIFVEINLRSKKWLIWCPSNSNDGLIQNCTINLSKNLDFYSSKYENFIVISDFNAKMTNNYMQEFCESYNITKLIKQRTWYKNLKNPTLTYHILTNHTKCFHLSSIYETGLFDFDKLTLTVLKVSQTKHKPKIIKYRDFNHCNNGPFRSDPLQELSLQNFQPGEFEKFKYISLKVLIMTRSRLLNQYMKDIRCEASKRI